jgi:hypothetical protein
LFCVSNWSIFFCKSSFSAVHCFTLSSMLSMYSFLRRRESWAETCKQMQKYLDGYQMWETAWFIYPLSAVCN